MSWWKTVVPGTAVWALTLTPVLSQVSNEKALVIASNFARTCYIDMLDARLKCGGRPLRTLSSAKALLSSGRLAKGDEPGLCDPSKATWIFQWRAFPEKPSVIVDGYSGKLMDADRKC